MNIQWETYFLTREKERKKERKQRKKRILFLGIFLAAVFVFAAGAGFFCSDSSGNEYTKIKKAVKAGDYRLPEAKMSAYLNQKYGTGICTAEELDASWWDPTSGREYPGFEGIYEKDSKKRVYMIYLSKEEVVFFDTFQWEEISQALEQEAAALTGIREVSVDTARTEEREFSKADYYCPWRQLGAYQTLYEGDLETFFEKEEQARTSLKGSRYIEKGQGINGCYAFYFADSQTEDMRAKIKNPETVDVKQYEKGLKHLEEKYRIDLFSCVLVKSHYTELVYTLTEKDGYRGFPTQFADYGKNQMFYNPAFALVSYAYGKTFEIKAKEVAEGMYLFAPKEVQARNCFLLQTEEKQAEMERKANEELRGWEYQESFVLQGTEKRKEYADDFCVLAIDLEARYPGKETAVMSSDDSGHCGVLDSAGDYPADIYSSYHVQDGFYIVNSRNSALQSCHYGIWCRE